MTFPPSEIIDLVERIASILRENNATLAVSEAACGGLLSAYLVLIPGALDFYIGGKLVYALRQRLHVLGWLQNEILKYVGPLEQVVLRLARNARYELGLTYVLSESGFAGPSSNLRLPRIYDTKDSSQSENENALELGVSTCGEQSKCINDERSESDDIIFERVTKSAEFDEPSIKSMNRYERLDESKIGTVYLGLSGPGGDCSCVRSTGLTVRAFNMCQFAKLGLEFLLEQLLNDKA